MNDWAAKIERELGAISTDLKNITEDRKEDRQSITTMRDCVGEVNSNIIEMRGDIKNLHQAVSSSAHTLSSMSTERCGERLDALERDCTQRQIAVAALQEDMRFYKRVFGGAWGIILRLVALVGALTAAFEAIHKWT